MKEEGRKEGRKKQATVKRPPTAFGGGNRVYANCPRNALDRLAPKGL
jgi:hypothetical protein